MAKAVVHSTSSTHGYVKTGTKSLKSTPIKASPSAPDPHTGDAKKGYKRVATSPRSAHPVVKSTGGSDDKTKKSDAKLTQKLGNAPRDTSRSTTKVGSSPNKGNKTKQITAPGVNPAKNAPKGKKP